MAHPLEPFKLVEGDRIPIIEGTLRRERDGERPNLAAGSLMASSVWFQMRASGAGSLILEAVATMFDATGAIVGYPWGNGETSPAGHYQGRFQVRFAAGASLFTTIPNQGWIPIEIEPAL